MQGYLGSALFHKLQVNGKALQVALNKAGFPCGKPDGRIGPQTREAVREFQKANGLKGDGVIGLKTLKALLSYVGDKKEKEVVVDGGR
jgi:peptidoglycan hydrolase-like protein with peptidoglycan-binding domain